MSDAVSARDHTQATVQHLTEYLNHLFAEGLRTGLVGWQQTGMICFKRKQMQFPNLNAARSCRFSFFFLACTPVLKHNKPLMTSVHLAAVHISCHTRTYRL